MVRQVVFIANVPTHSTLHGGGSLHPLSSPLSTFLGDFVVWRGSANPCAPHTRWDDWAYYHTCVLKRKKKHTGRVGKSSPLPRPCNVRAVSTNPLPTFAPYYIHATWLTNMPMQ